MSQPVLILNEKEVALSRIKEGSVNASTPFERETLDFCRQWLNGQSTFSFRTSGSTGEPKLITATREQMLASASNTIHFFNLSPDDTVLVCLNTAYIAGKMLLVRAIESTSNIVAMEPCRNPLANVNLPISFMAVVPLQLASILDDPVAKLKLETMKAVIVGGAAIPFLLQKKMQLSNANIYESFGMTETMSHIALRQLSPEYEHEFTAFENIELGVNDQSCLTIKGPVTGGRLLSTHDKVDMSGTHTFKWLGRIDNVINTGGVKVQLETLEVRIEEIFVSMNLDYRFFVTAKNDKALGQRLVLVVEGEKGKMPALLPALKSALPRYEVPKEIIIEPHFSETSSGKIDRIKTSRLFL